MVIEEHMKAIEAMLPDLVAELTVEARNYFDRSWSDKGFTDEVLEKWKPVYDKSGKEKDRPLVQSGALRRSLRTEVTGSVGVVYTEVAYAQIHNEGGAQRYTAAVREHQRKGKTVKAHTRRVERMMPKRQFMGPSKRLDEIMTGIIEERLKAIFNGV
ncbi:MAG TPA: phage virion morphogenesis protein [Saprospiraceae bacterium]|jgi:phage gpG-like protein|nr:phage virion morphogenesis protein [Saprospiraceae bacterium]HRP41971.1 phage virion morphogenesis protein [Saprospiraceae bacterium]